MRAGQGLPGKFASAMGRAQGGAAPLALDLAMRRVPITSQGEPRTVAAKPAEMPAVKCRPMLSGKPRCSR